MGLSADGILSYLDLVLPQPHLFGQWLIFCSGIPYYVAFEAGTAYRQNLVSTWLDLVHIWRPNAPPYDTVVKEHEGYSEVPFVDDKPLVVFISFLHQITFH